MKFVHFLESEIAGIFLVVACLVINGFSQSTITVNVDGATTAIPNELYGVLMERLGKQFTGGLWVGTNSSTENVNGMRKDIIDGFKECGVGAIEWPGGCAANDYDWSTNKNPTNDVGTDRFMQLCGLVGAEPIIAGKGQSSGAASNLAWVTYINNNATHPEWNLKYFKVGNEVWGCGGNQNVSTYISNYTANYQKLKDPINGKKLFIVAGNDQEGSWAWLPAMLKSIGTTIDGVEYHDYLYFPDSYSSTNPTTAQYWEIVNEANNSHIKAHLDNNVLPPLNSYDPDKKIKVILDEWGDWLKDTGDGWMQQITVMDALSAAEQLHIFMQRADRIQVACLAQAVNVIHALMNINTSGKMVKTPAFYVFKMFKPHHTNNAKLAPITASTIQTISGGGATMPVLTACATVADGGIVNISFSNVDLSASRSVTVTLTSNKASYTVMSAEVITGTALNSFNDYGAAEQVNIKTLETSNYSINGKTLTATLPSKSIVMFRLGPPTAVLPESFHKYGTDAFSIKSGSQGTVLITSSVSCRSTVAISLCSIDGRISQKTISKVFQPGKCTLTIGRNVGKGVYIVIINGAGFNLKQKIVVTR